MKLEVCWARIASDRGHAFGLVEVVGKLGLLALMVGCFVQPLAAGTSVEFKQAANNDSGFGLGNTHWINSIIQDNNSDYYESMSVLQRVLFAGLPPTSGNHHSLLFRHQFTKGGVHAYDFLTSYAQAQADNAGALGVMILVNPCGNDIGPPASLATICSVLLGGTNLADVAVPADSFVSKDGSTATRIAAYEAGHGPRTIRILGDAPISNAALSVCHDVANGGDTGDSFALYALTWDSASTSIVIEMAGHLSISGDGSGATWGKGLGSGFLTGGSYHFKLDSLSGGLTDSNCPPGQIQQEVVSLGSQDNQIRSSSLLPPPPCHVTGLTPVCPGSTNVYQGASFGPNLTYAWSITGNGSLLGSTTGSTVTVLAGNGGSYTVSVILTVTSGPLTTNSTCALPVVVNPLPACSISGSPTVCPSSSNGYSGPGGMVSYVWSIGGGGTISGSTNSQIIHVASSSDCATNFTLTLTVIDTNGCVNTCAQTISVQDTTPPAITCPPAVTVSCPGEVPPHDFAGGNAIDNCPGDVTVIWVSDEISNQTCPNRYTVTRTYKAIDVCGNFKTCAQIITVDDETPPTITCPPAVTVSCPDEVPPHDFAGGSTIDNCPGDVTVIWVSDEISNQTCPNRYTVTRTYKATDVCGNFKSCAQIITVDDETPPTITCPPAVTVSCPGDVPPHDFAGGSAIDNCPGDVTVIWVSDEISNQTCPNRYTVTRTYKGTDVCGNFKTCAQIITIDDETPPIITCPPPVTVSCPPDLPPHDFVGGSASDNCPGAVTVAWVSDEISNQTCPNRYTVTRTYKATDVCGNFKTCAQIITVDDETPPIITCPPKINAAENPRYSGGAIVNFPLAFATDNCTANPQIFSSPVPGSLLTVGTNIVTGTAVDECNNSKSCSFIVRVISYQLFVTNLNNSGQGSLRQALLDANDSPDENLVTFSLPGQGPYTIQLLSSLPQITSPIILDGWSQSASNAPPVIELAGGAASNTMDGLVITAGSSSVRGLAFHGFATAIRLTGAGSNVIQGNFIGTDLSGTNAAGNLADGIYVSSPGNLIGGTPPGTGNVISANSSNGVVFASSSASNNVVQGNLIGAGLGGGALLGNGANGILFNDQASGNLIGGMSGGSANVIEFNGGNGITLAAAAGTGNGLLGNRILSNARLGIDLGGDGETPNDPGDSDAGPNEYQNFPVLSDVQSIQGRTTMFGNLSSLPYTTFRIEFYLNDNVDSSGSGEGQTFVGSTSITTPASGIASFAVSFPLTATYTQFITATATDPRNNTSEFSPAVQVRTPPILGAGPASTNVAVGATATFCATATGTPPIFYQWRLNGFNIPGATNPCYTIPAAQVGQGGTYTVVVGNVLDAVATLPATMTLTLSNIPAGTNFAGRAALAGSSGQITGQNRNGTFEPGEPLHAGKPGGKAVWYTWTAPFTGVVTMQTSGSTFDTLLAVYTGTALTNLVVIDSDEGHGGFYTSLVKFNAFQGTQYQIAIDGFGGDSGDFILSWQEENTSHMLPIFLVQPAGQTIAPGQDATFTALAARVCGNGQINCNEPNPQLLYQWAFYGNPIPGATTNTFTATNVQPAQVGIYTLTISTPWETNQSDNAVLQINLTGSSVEEVQAADKLLDATDPIIVGDGSPQALAQTDGSEPRPLVASIVRGYTGTQIFNTTGSATSPGEVICGVIGGASEWISFVAEVSGNLFLNTDGSSYDTVVAMYRRSPTNSTVLELLGCDNNSGTNGSTSSLSLPVVAGQTNYIVVDGVNGITGILQLNYSLATTSLIKSLGVTPQGKPHLQITGRPDLHFSIQSSTNLINWTSLITTTNSPTGVFDFIDNDSANLPRRYYRTLLLP